MNLPTWSTFYKESNKLTKPASAKKLITAQDISEFKLLLIDVLIGFLAKQELHIGLKVYINNKLRNDIIEQMAANPPKLENSLENWTKQIFGDQKFGIVLIGLEQYSNSFAEKAATIVRPLQETAGMPLNGLSFLFFMGNYGFTPFGIHKEATGEDGILFHLGPENKQFYTWDDPKYNVITHNSQVFHDVDKMLSEGEMYQLEPGDAMFIPHYVYHIANTPEFSVSVVLDYINPPKDQFENNLLKATAAAQIILKDNYEKPINLNASKIEIANLIDIESIKQKIETTLSHKLLGLKSNGGIGRKSIKTNFNIPSTEAFSIKGKQIFPIYLSELNSKQIRVFARGHQIIKDNNAGLAILLDRLNGGESVSFSTIKQILEPSWDMITILGFIQDLLIAEAVEVAKQ